MPKQTELSITYSVSVRANLGNYEHSDAFVSRGERWNVEDMTEEEIDAFYQERYEQLHTEIGARVEIEYKEMLGL